MSSQILLSYKADETTHTASDDLELLVYILIWMCVLYAGPGTLRQDKHITNTVTTGSPRRSGWRTEVVQRSERSRLQHTESSVAAHTAARES